MWLFLKKLLQMKTRSINILLALILITLIFSCKKDQYKIKTSSEKPEIEIKRLEKDLFSLNPDEIPRQLPVIREQYREFLQLFSLVINTGDINDPSFTDFLVRFCTDKQNNDVFSVTTEVYPDIKEIEEGLEDAFRYYLHYFPDENPPAVFTCITGFNASIITGDSILGIGLDRYLGADNEYYPMLEIYNYIAARMNPENIVPDCIYGWAASDWDKSLINYKTDNLLSEIIHEGKLKYFQKCMLPETSDELIFGFNTDQMNFCRNNESQMWLYLIEHDLLFTTDQFQIRKFTGEAPFTSYFSNESPGKAAVWLGFRIVESFMKNSKVELRDLMSNPDFQSILEKAKYNPQ
jgi:hypothetical protein